MRKAIVLAAMLVVVSISSKSTPATAADFPLLLPPADSVAAPASPCWVEEVSPIGHAVTPTARRKPRLHMSAARRAAKRNRERSHQPRRSSPPRIWVPKMSASTNYRWDCAPMAVMPLAKWSLEPFASDFANIMLPYPGDELVQQWIIDRPRPRHHGRRFEPIPAAPEPATWIALVGGLGLVGATLRRSRTRRIGTFTHSAQNRLHANSGMSDRSLAIRRATCPSAISTFSSIPPA